MAWLYLFIAGLSEICWAISVKNCDGIRPGISLMLMIATIALSIFCFGNAIKTIPLSVAYAVWTGMGIVGVFIYDVLILKETILISNMVFVGMILTGIIGLKLQVK